MEEKFWQESFSELLEIILCLVTDLLNWTQHKKHPAGAVWVLFLSSILLFIKLLNICLTPLAKRMLSSEYKNGLFLSRALQCPTEILFSLQVVFDSGTPWTAAHQASLSPGVCSNSCLLSLWCHPTISFSVACFSPCPQSFPASGSFLMSPLFASGGQSIGASTSASVLPMNIQGSFPLGPNGLISLSPRTAHESSLAPQFKSIHSSQPSLWSSSHIRTWLLEKPHLWLFKPLSAKWCLCFLVYYLGLS